MKTTFLVLPNKSPGFVGYYVDFMISSTVYDINMREMPGDSFLMELNANFSTPFRGKGFHLLPKGPERWNGRSHPEKQPTTEIVVLF